MKIRISLIISLFIIITMITGCNAEKIVNTTFEEAGSQYDSAIYIDLFAFDSKILKGDDDIDVLSVLMSESEQRLLYESKDVIKENAPYPGIVFFNKTDTSKYISFKTDDYIKFYNDDLCFEYNIRKEHLEDNDLSEYESMKEVEISSLNQENYVMKTYSDFLKMEFQTGYCSVVKESGVAEFDNYSLVWDNKGLNKDAIVLWEKNENTGFFRLRNKSKNAAIFYRKNKDIFVNQEGEYILTDKLRDLYFLYGKK